MATVPPTKIITRTAATLLLPAFAALGIALTNPTVTHASTNTNTVTVNTSTSRTGATITGDRTARRAPILITTPAPNAAVPARNTARIATLVYNKINAYRVANGRTALRRHTGLEVMSQRWAKTMASQNRMYHNLNYTRQAPKGWKSLGENVAFTTAWRTVTDDQIANTLFTLWINSPGHRANLLRSNYNYASMGIAVASNGTIYATQNFARY